MHKLTSFLKNKPFILFVSSLIYPSYAFSNFQGIYIGAHLGAALLKGTHLFINPHLG